MLLDQSAISEDEKRTKKAQVPRKYRPDWPFLFYEEGGKQYINIAPRKPRKDEVKEVGEALW